MTRQQRAGLIVAVAASAALPLYRAGVELPPLAPAARVFAAATAGVLELAGVAVARQGTTLRHAGGFAVEVGVHCTAWLHFMLWLTALLALQPAWRRGLVAGAAGISVLGVVNLVRLVGVVTVGIGWPEAFDWVHRVAGEGLLAAALVLLWWHAPREVDRP